MLATHPTCLLAACATPRRLRRSYSTAPSRARLLNLLFLGSDAFSIHCLRAVLAAQDLAREVQVVTMPEKAVGRGGRGKGKERDGVRPPLYEYAAEQGLQIHQIPRTGIRDWTLPPPFDRSPGADPDQSNILITASFGALLPPSLLARFPLPHTRLNVHPSLLPRLRGAAPIQWSLVRSAAVEGEAGDTAESKETGVCVQCLARGMDTGDLFGLRAGISIERSDDYASMLAKLGPAGGDLLVSVLRDIQADKATSIPQDPAIPPSLAPKITLDTARVRLAAMSAERVGGLFRGIGHQQSLWTHVGDKVVQLLEVEVANPANCYPVVQSLEPGQGIFVKRHPEAKQAASSSSAVGGSASAILVRAGTGLDPYSARSSVLAVRRLRTAGGKTLVAGEWWNGSRKLTASVSGRAEGDAQRRVEVVQFE